MRTKKEKKGNRKDSFLSLLKISGNEEENNDFTKEEEPELQTDLIQQEEEEPATPLQMFLSDTYSNESIYLLGNALKSDEMESIGDIDPYRGLQKKIKLGCNLARTLTEKFQQIGVTSVTLPATTAPRICVANHYKDVISTMLRDRPGNSITEVSFDVFDDGITDGMKTLSYLCTFTAYFMVKCGSHYGPLISLNGQGDLKEQAMEKMELEKDDGFVIRVSFKMIYAFQGPASASFTKDGEIGLRNIIISGANYIINDIIHDDETLQRMELDADRILSDEVIFREIAEYKNNFSGKITWKKNEYTMFDPSINQMTVKGIENDYGTITGNIDFSDDISELMYKF